MVDHSVAFKNESKNLGLPAYGINDHRTHCCEPACTGHFVCTFGEEAGISRKIVQQRKCSACVIGAGGSASAPSRAGSLCENCG